MITAAAAHLGDTISKERILFFALTVERAYLLVTCSVIRNADKGETSRGGLASDRLKAITVVCR